MICSCRNQNKPFPGLDKYEYAITAAEIKPRYQEESDGKPEVGAWPSSQAHRAFCALPHTVGIPKAGPAQGMLGTGQATWLLKVALEELRET